MVSRRKIRGLIGFDGAVFSCTWQVAEDYFVYGNEIRPDDQADLFKQTMYSPLADPNLFLSFSRLGARGDHLPQALALRWVRKHGLLRLKDPRVDRLYLNNQASITVADFREEARRAHEALTIFEAIRTKNWDELRPRLSRKPSDPSRESSSDQVYLDGQPIPVLFEADRELSDEAVYVAAVNGLEAFVQARLENVHLVFDHYSGHPNPVEVYRPRIVVSVPDLHAAIWCQLASLMADARPAKFCQVCKGPIIRPRSNQKTCSAACRKEKSRRSRPHKTSF